jgi:hypothetical protein
MAAPKSLIKLIRLSTRQSYTEVANVAYAAKTNFQERPSWRLMSVSDRLSAFNKQGHRRTGEMVFRIRHQEKPIDGVVLDSARRPKARYSRL